MQALLSVECSQCCSWESHTSHVILVPDFFLSCHDCMPVGEIGRQQRCCQMKEAGTWALLVVFHFDQLDVEPVKFNHSKLVVGVILEIFWQINSVQN